MIKVKELSKKYNRFVIKKFNYEFDKGLYLIVGESGIGKTTLLNILGNVDKKYDGKLWIGDNLLYFKDKDTLPNDLTVREVFYLFELANDFKINLYFNIKKILKKKIKKLSLGEKQLVILNLVLNSKENIVILDEPLSALSYSNRVEACELIEQLSKDKLIIIASHDISGFKNYKLINMENLEKKRIDDFENYVCENKKKFKIKYHLIYLKKTLIKKMIFILSLFITIISFIYVHNYTNNLVDEYLKDFKLNEGVLIERKNEINSIGDNIFYEIIKRLSPYVLEYNANYYNSKLYDYDVMVDGLYIDNAFMFSSFNYVEEMLNDDEVILGINYKMFCTNNKILDCNESYLKSLLVNKKIEHFNFNVKDIFQSEDNVVLSNKRFNKIYNDNEYIEYYLDLHKKDVDEVFEIINNDEFLLEFDFLKLKENSEKIRYKVEIDGKKNFNEKIEYSKYIVCLEKGYNCKNYINKFSSLLKIDEFEKNSLLNFKIIEKDLELNEIVISSGLSKVLNKNKEDNIYLLFEYNDLIKEVILKIKDIVEDNNLTLYQNSNWSYSFFKEILKYSEEDLKIENILIYENIKYAYYQSEDLYKIALKEVRGLLVNMRKNLIYINIVLNIGSVIILIFIEMFSNKFKKEYFGYLKIIGINKKVPSRNF